MKMVITSKAKIKAKPSIKGSAVSEAAPKRALRKKQIKLTDQIIETLEPSFQAFHIDEPNLLFASGGLSVDPKTGLELYGPLQLDEAGSRTIRIGIIGTSSGIQLMLDFLTTTKSKIRAGFNSRKRPYDFRCFPDFPGCSPLASFRCDMVSESSFQRTLRGEDFDNALEHVNTKDRVKAVVRLVEQEMAAIADLETSPDVVVLVMPQGVEDACRRQGHTARGSQQRSSKSQMLQKRMSKKFESVGQLTIPLDLSEELESEPGFRNLHHSLKAHCMKYDVPTQLVWESTLIGENVTQDPASIAWNLLTAIYYKAGNRPWQLQNLPENVCYVGVSFYKEKPDGPSDLQTSLAQVFGAGEGLVLKGERAVVDKKRDRKAHLTEEGAENLLRQAIDLFRKQNNTLPKRVVVHKTSRYWPEELKGFKKALNDVHFYDFLTIEESDVRFMRIGTKPPLRGTTLKLADRHYLLYTTGYVPYLEEYPGMRIPKPLEIFEHHGHSTTLDVCRELIALSKLNWNSCAICSSQPITILFARAVGRILTELPEGTDPRTKYKYYM